jgi:hypothetical protein
LIIRWGLTAAFGGGFLFFFGRLLVLAHDFYFNV